MQKFLVNIKPYFISWSVIHNLDYAISSTQIYFGPRIQGNDLHGYLYSLNVIMENKR